MEKYFVNEASRKYYCCEFPKKCPICKNSISPDMIQSHVNLDLSQVYILFACPDCGKDFITHYNITFEEKVHGGLKYSVIYEEGSYPNTPEVMEFDESINILSEKFCTIYNQSHSAEIYELNEIAGMGYRKSLEFLIKDYCIKYNKDKEDQIKKMPLSQVIEEFVESEKIKKLSKASTWIGNDETHYVKIWDDKDIEDLKKFIRAIVSFITYDISVEEATNMIESKGN